MLTRIAVWLGMGLAPACFGQEKPDLGLFLRFDTRPAPVFLQTMEKELTGILSPAAFTLHWVMGGQASVYTRALTIRFHGTCSGQPERADAGIDTVGRISLAESVTAGATVLPYSEIDCDRLRAFLQSSEADLMPGREARFGRATGRVLAHELYHVLLQTQEHSKTGIARAAHTPAALLSQSLRFENGELEKMRARYSESQLQRELERPLAEARGSAGALSETR